MADDRKRYETSPWRFSIVVAETKFDELTEKYCNRVIILKQRWRLKG